MKEVAGLDAVGTGGRKREGAGILEHALECGAGGQHAEPAVPPTQSEKRLLDWGSGVPGCRGSGVPGFEGARVVSKQAEIPSCLAVRE